MKYRVGDKVELEIDGARPTRKGYITAIEFLFGRPYYKVEGKINRYDGAFQFESIISEDKIILKYP